jgi:DNA ligase-1
MKPMLARKYEGENVKGWLMSEKFDGVRALWTGEKLLSRNGGEFNAPSWFIDQLPPDMMLDGELYINRGKFQKTVGIIRTKDPIDKDWEQISYCIFDAPEIPGDLTTRLAEIKKRISKNKVCRIVEQNVCDNAEDMETFFERILEQGGEGIILRNPKSNYEQKRSDQMLKYKPFDSDEAVIIGYQNGQGKYANMVGALVCRWKDIIFQIGAGLTDELHKTPPAVGDSITFQYNGKTDKGLPRFPVFLCARNYEA